MGSGSNLSGHRRRRYYSPIEWTGVIHDVHGRRVEQVSKPHDPLWRDMFDHALVQSQGTSPLNGKEFDPLSRVFDLFGKVLILNRVHIVSHNICVPDDGGIVHNLAYTVDYKHNMSDIRKSVWNSKKRTEFHMIHVSLFLSFQFRALRLELGTQCAPLIIRNKY